MNKLIYNLGKAYSVLVAAHPPAGKNLYMTMAPANPMTTFARAHNEATAAHAISPQATKALTKILSEVTETVVEPLPLERQGDWWLGYYHGANLTTNGLKARRLARKMTQKELAAELGINQSTIAHWEKGESVVSQEIINKAAAFFGVDPEELENK